MIFVFGLTGRSGTTSLMLALKDTLGKKYISEPFSAEAPMKGIKFPVVFETFAGDMRAHNYGVLKTLHYQQESVERNLELIRQFDKIVFMYRKNITDYTISEHLSGSYKQLTGNAVYHTYDFEAPEISIVPNRFYSEVREPLDTKRVEQNFRFYKEALDAYLEAFENEGIEFETIVYEEFFTNRVDQNFFELCDKLEVKKNPKGLQWLSPDQRLNRNTEFEKLIPNYREVLNVREAFVLDSPRQQTLH